CFLDYDRELAIMAEIELEGTRRFIGVGRLVADPNHQSAEFALLGADAWENLGVGLKLTDHCLENPPGGGVQRMIAETSLDNARMISIFEQRGFRIDRNLLDGAVVVERSLVE